MMLQIYNRFVWKTPMSNQVLSPEKNPWGWKAIVIATILSVLFLGIFYLAMSNEPDYMPSKKHEMQQHAFKQQPAMSAEAMAEAQQQDQARQAAQEKHSAEAVKAHQAHESMQMQDNAQHSGH